MHQITGPDPDNNQRQQVVKNVSCSGMRRWRRWPIPVSEWAEVYVPLDTLYVISGTIFTDQMTQPNSVKAQKKASWPLR